MLCSLNEFKDSLKQTRQEAQVKLQIIKKMISKENSKLTEWLSRQDSVDTKLNILSR